MSPKYNSLKAVTFASLAFGVSALPALEVRASASKNAEYKHVVMFSIDGMHGSDVTKYVKARPNSTMAALLETGYEYMVGCYATRQEHLVDERQNAWTSAPSDSFPGTIAQVAGGTPKTTGIWYDDTWDWTYWNPSSNCTGAPGANGIISLLCYVYQVC